MHSVIPVKHPPFFNLGIENFGFLNNYGKFLLKLKKVHYVIDLTAIEYDYALMDCFVFDQTEYERKKLPRDENGKIIGTKTIFLLEKKLNLGFIFGKYPIFRKRCNLLSKKKGWIWALLLDWSPDFRTPLSIVSKNLQQWIVQSLVVNTCLRDDKIFTSKKFPFRIS
ncbi:hypothetical protein BpHYR1_053765 [Brachionus plicatilis]|uniref:Uncharacterized protein n=1 Tax=Brachionus plicatilis TaxID=10195 RepID=A0A3M7QLB4_BRAPC|nr:hypothetical protein BpHYR1_053765 [Brachionus plicatilis]